MAEKDSANIILVYASMTGNTEEIANLIAKGVTSAGANLTIRELPSGDAKELAEYDGIIFGSYTYGDGELADEFFDFYEDMAALDLAGKTAAVFGSGDMAYEYFCAAVDILSERLTELGATIVQQGLKIELAPEDEEICIQFGRNFAEQTIAVKSIIQS